MLKLSKAKIDIDTSHIKELKNKIIVFIRGNLKSVLLSYQHFHTYMIQSTEVLQSSLHILIPRSSMTQVLGQDGSMIQTISTSTKSTIELVPDTDWIDKMTCDTDACCISLSGGVDCLVYSAYLILRQVRAYISIQHIQ